MITSRDEDGATLIVPTETDPPADVVETWVRAVLRDLPEPLRLRATLVTLDLLAAARARRSAPYVVRLTVLDRRRTLAVWVDDCTPAHGGPDPDLTLVAGLSTRWGVEQRALARTTWAELAAETGTILLGGPDQPRPTTGDRRAR